jgi:hypothetical protein
MIGQSKDVYEFAVLGAAALTLGLRIRVPPFNSQSLEYAYRSGLKYCAIAVGVGSLLVALRLLVLGP